MLHMQTLPKLMIAKQGHCKRTLQDWTLMGWRMPKSRS